MTKITREAVVVEALNLLDEVGLDAVSTRRLAARLGVEQPALYWHFRKKSDLLADMAQAAMRPHAAAALPTPADDWPSWFVENYRGFRETLLRRRDGARLHAGLRPSGTDLERIHIKQAFLEEAGLPQRDAQMAMLAASRFTVGSVLEEQAETDEPFNPADQNASPPLDHDAAFSEGLQLIVEGLRHRT